MIVTKKAIPRRTVLRGLGAAVALPLLDSMVPALAAARRTVASPVVRLGAIYLPVSLILNVTVMVALIRMAVTGAPPHHRSIHISARRRRPRGA